MHSDWLKLAYFAAAKCFISEYSNYSTLKNLRDCLQSMLPLYQKGHKDMINYLHLAFKNLGRQRPLFRLFSTLHNFYNSIANSRWYHFNYEKA